MSRLQQDTFIDEDDEETCPLCVEELDIQDRNFRPCPCGYQICQFCFNNINQNLNNLCPACRREYREETMQYTPISADELKAEENKKKRAATERRKMEAQKRELDALNKRHLAGMRVIQRNLVYVTGLNPTVEEERLLQTLRGPDYFGQYGKIIKIVVNKRTAQSNTGNSHYRDSEHQSQGLGVYVTFSNKHEAELCIKAVDGSQNGERTLRATYGTTKYCSAYLRNETCTNKHCMFLHEAGEDAESFSRMELSTANSRQTREQAHAQLAPPPRAAIAAAAPSNEIHPPPMARSSSHINDDSSALPVTANWAKNPPTPATRPASLVHQLQTPKTSTPSPKIVPASPLPQPSKLGSGRSKGSTTKTSNKNVGVIGQKPGTPGPSTQPQPQPQPEPPAAVAAAPPPKTPAPPPPRRLEEPTYHKENRDRWINLLKAVSALDSGFHFDSDALSADDYQTITNMPPLWNSNGGALRREILNRATRKPSASETSQVDTRTVPTMMGAAGAASGVAPPPMGLQGVGSAMQQQQRDTAVKDSINQLPALQALQHEALQQQHASLRSQTPQGLLQQAAQNFNGFQPGSMGLPQQQQQGHQPGHARQSSRYTFANDNAGSAATQVNARGNAAHMAEQARMMPPQQQQLSHLYGGQSLSTGMLGTVPPPGLKSAPTPPAPGLGGIPMGNVPGMGQFSGMALGHNKEHNEALIRELLGGNASRMGGSSSGLMRGMEGKRNVPFSAGGAPGFTNRRGVVDHLADPSILQARVAQPQNQLHQQGIQAGGHGQPGGYNPGMSAYYTSAAGGWR
ncbi:hypothetical protein EX30DRAFT_165080 [Ascodesmis nigricans]|uniref:RING-type domain-containing protein n=1 Tax=Ascodesmis nigricans TaxID=341454 RepID=A0A4S2MMN2_9PEZI|nr:hypothetical protein EX30DRAFT_165080 [Ascodesmis nigricans]